MKKESREQVKQWMVEGFSVIGVFVGILMVCAASFCPTDPTQAYKDESREFVEKL